jgi:ABC-2 type transport system ATP-binding protein
MAAVLAPELDRGRDLAKPSRPVLQPAICVDSLVHRFDDKIVLDSVSLDVAPGSIHALLGPNGAGKTTLLRILAGLLVPREGTVRVLGHNVDNSRAFRGLIGLVPSGDRSFYLRISGLENLVFFGRLYGATKRDAVRRANALLEQVGLADVAKVPVGFYSHGMQKRLSVARALLDAPPILLVDEATHDLDPEGARRVRDLVADAAAQSTAVVWATQRLDEIRGLCDGVTLIAEGRVAFLGSVPELMAHAVPRRYLVRLRSSRPIATNAVGALGTIAPSGEPSSGHYLLVLRDDAVLGAALGALAANGVDVITCTEERSEIEQAFLSLAGGRR